MRYLPMVASIGQHNIDNTMPKNRYWCRFKFSGSEDYRSLIYPPTENVRGYWATGYGDNPTKYTSIVVVIDAATMEDAIRIIKVNWLDDIYDQIDIDFIEKKENDFIPPADRFPANDWMEIRLVRLHGG